MKVLVVDDREDNRYFLNSLLTGNGHSVVLASHGAEALETARVQLFDLVVSDVLMPQMDGFQLCREMKADPSLCHIPFVFYSATYTDPKDIEFGMSLGAQRYLIKPLEADDLLHELTEAAMRPGKTTVTPIDEDPAYLKQYNSRLIAKLEKKMLDLEAANHALQEDLKHRERLEKQLREAQKMEAVGRLAGGIAHDFNNILGGIIGFAELALIEDELPDAARNNIQGILNTAQRARDLVQQILSFSRRREHKREATHLAAALEDPLAMLRASLPAGIQLRCTIDCEAPAVLADLTEIHQIITNLVTNAWHAIGERGGTIDVAVSTLHVDADFAAMHPGLKTGRHVRLTVTDDGCGMEPATLEHVFEPFFTTKDPGKGNGLGLSIVHGIMHSSGGITSIESEPGRGTTVTLYFPALDEEPAPKTSPQPRASNGAGQRILFVDDDPTLGTLAARFFSRIGYVVQTENNPLNAIESFRTGEFDLVITDLTMPYATGLDVARECRDIRPSVPVILITGFNPALTPDDLRAHGIVSLVNKPYTIQTLAAAVAAALGTA